MVGMYLSGNELSLVVTYQGWHIDVCWKSVLVYVESGLWSGLLIRCHRHLILSGQMIVIWELIAVPHSPIFIIMFIHAIVPFCITDHWRVIEMDSSSSRDCQLIL